MTFSNISLKQAPSSDFLNSQVNGTIIHPATKDKNLNIVFHFFLLHLLHPIWHQIYSALSPKMYLISDHFSPVPSQLSHHHPSARPLQQVPNWPSFFHYCSPITHLLCNSQMILLKCKLDITPVSSAMNSHCSQQSKKRLILGFKTQQDQAPVSVSLQTYHCACRLQMSPHTSFFPIQVTLVFDYFKQAMLLQVSALSHLLFLLPGIPAASFSCGWSLSFSYWFQWHALTEDFPNHSA